MRSVSRRTARWGVAGALGVALALLSASPAAAATTDYAAAVASNELDRVQSAAATASANLSNPNVTCSTPTAAGMVVTKSADLYVVEVRGTDGAGGEGRCASFQHDTYRAYLTIAVEYYDAESGTWIGICRKTVGSPAVKGFVEVVAQPVVCSYSAAAGPAGKPHRAHAMLMTSLDPDTVYHGYSAVYPGGEAAPSPEANVAVPDKLAPYTQVTIQ